MLESVLVAGEQILDAAELIDWQLTNGALGQERPRQLLAHVAVTEDAEYHDAYASLTVFALQAEGGSGAVITCCIRCSSLRSTSSACCVAG